jgi:hypothetical protein
LLLLLLLLLLLPLLLLRSQLDVALQSRKV